MSMMLLMSVMMVFTMLSALINVAFVTLFERKILGLSQSRKGPNKVGPAGLFQPFSDAVKLFSKESARPSASLTLIYSLGPLLGLFLVLLLWAVIPFTSGGWAPQYSVLLLLALLSLGLYPLLMAGWSSSSAYASLGALRGVAQTISYEISLALVLFSLCVHLGVWTLLDLQTHHATIWQWALLSPMWLLWLVSCVAETNRTPFDFSEGESELVSGFNIEYGAKGFMLIFMAEYASILFLAGLTALFWSPHSLSVAAGLLVAISGGWMWLRATLPRYRYDKLMSLAWKSLLPESLVFAFFFCGCAL